jgi:predicted nucleic acid-binding protein
MYTIDASVWVNAFDQREPGHADSRQFLDLVGAQAIPVFVPALVLAEVAGAISRTRQDPAQARSFAEAIARLPNVAVITLDLSLSHRALALAAQHGLRGADAIYAAVALQSGSSLITLDKEHLTRLVGVVLAETPAAALAGLAPPSPPAP